MKTSAAVALLLATDNARALHTRAQKNIRALMAARSHGGNLLKLKEEPCDEGQDCSPKNEQVLLQTQSDPIPEGTPSPFQSVPWGYVMGDNPQWMILSRSEVVANGLPDGFYVPDLWFLEQYTGEIENYVNNQIGEWAIVAFEGGKLGGTGYSDWGYSSNSPLNIVLTTEDQGEMFYVNEDTATDDVLVVGADPSMTPEDTGVPTCDIPGFDCNCERLQPVDPFSRKPVPTCPNYTWHSMDETGFTGLKQERGWSYEGSWVPIPDGWWGADIWLDQWAIFGYEDFEEWKFGVKIRSNQDGTIQGDDRWCINDGVEFYDGWGDETYEYMYKVPDQSTDYDFEVGYCYTPVLYDATVDGGEYIDGETPSFDGLPFCIGEPYMPLDDMEINAALINAFFVFADGDEDGCATRDEMTALYEEAINMVETGDTLGYLDAVFSGGDMNGDGLMTWSEINQALPGIVNNGVVSQTRANAIQGLFQVFDSYGDMNYALSEQEAIDGVQEIASYLSGFYDEFNYYWRFFNGFGGDFEGAPFNYDPNDHPEECLYLEELESTIQASYEVTLPEIREYWQQWYLETYDITSFYFDMCYLGNGEFDFDCYWATVPDGPAFDGAEWLVLHGDWETGTLMQAFMWFYQNQCYFSIGSPQYQGGEGGGTCTLVGHRNRGYYLQGQDMEHDVDEVDWWFDGTEENAHKFIYQLDQWGPIAEMTDERYKVEGDSFWLWQKTEGHCEVCVDYGDWYPSLVHPQPVVEEEVPAISMEVSESEEEAVATVAPEPEVTQIAGLADIIDYENSALTAEEKCQIAQEFYWAVLQILDTNNDGVMSIGEFENQAETLTGMFSFGLSDSLLDWFVDNAMATSANQGNTLTSRQILDTADHSDITDTDYLALDILIYYSDAFYSFPSWDGDGVILMSNLELALSELSAALTEMGDDGWFAMLDANGDMVVTWEEMIPYISSLCNPGFEFDIANFQPLPDSQTTEGEDLGVTVAA